MVSFGALINNNYIKAKIVILGYDNNCNVLMRIFVLFLKK